MKPKQFNASDLGKKLIQILKQLWVVFIFAAVGVYAFNNFNILAEEIGKIPVNSLLLSLGFLVLGRALMAEVSRQTIGLVGWSIHYTQMLYFYSMSQLARYLPGGIWHFVGLAGFYHGEGIPLKTASKAILLEYAWLAVSASFVGMTLCSVYFLQANLAVVLSMFILWAVTLWILHAIFRVSTFISVISSQMLLQIGVWILIGTSFWILMPDHNTWNMVFLDIGAFSISWVIGFVAVFAPGGIGVREGTLVMLLGSVLDTEVILVLAGIHRLLYVAADLCLFLIYQVEGTLKSILSEF